MKRSLLNALPLVRRPTLHSPHQGHECCKGDCRGCRRRRDGAVGHGVLSPPAEAGVRLTAGSYYRRPPSHDLGPPSATGPPPRPHHGSCPESCPGHVASSRVRRDVCPSSLRSPLPSTRLVRGINTSSELRAAQPRCASCFPVMFNSSKVSVLRKSLQNLV